MSTNPSKLFTEEKKGQHIYHNVWGGDDLHIGIYRPKSLSLYEANRKTTERMIKLLPKIKRASKVLVIQSGFGGAARFIAEEYKCKVWCLNDDEKQNEYNERKIEELELSKKVKVAKGFVEYMPYEPDYFDFVIGQDAFSLTGKKRETFRAIHGYLSPRAGLSSVPSCVARPARTRSPKSSSRSYLSKSSSLRSSTVRTLSAGFYSRFTA